MRKTNAEKLVAGLKERGYVVHGASQHIHHWKGQGMMNKAAGEAAPTWELRINPMWKFEKVIRSGEIARVTFPDGEVRTVEVCSHIPLVHTLKYPSSDWLISLDESLGPLRLTVEAPELPSNW